MVKSANPVDKNVGQRLRKRRIELGMSQQALGEILGLSFQQVQKYESGANRIAASRLYNICRTLEVEVGYFFEGVGESEALDEMSDIDENKLMTGREALELLRSYVSIKDNEVRRAVRAFLASVSKSQANE